MAAEVWLTNGKRFTSNVNDKETAYKVLPSGVLQLLSLNDAGEWIVNNEFGASSWASATGTRYVLDTETLDGAKGRAPVSAYEDHEMLIV